MRKLCGPAQRSNFVMNDSSRAETRRFRLSLAASVFLNLGLLVLVGRLGQPADLSHPQGRPHLRMVTLSLHPSPPSSTRRGTASGSRMTAAVNPPTRQMRPQHVPRPETLPQPPVRKPAAPSPALHVLRIVTTTHPSARAAPHQTHSDAPVQAPPIQAPRVQATPIPTVPLLIRLPVRLPHPSVSAAAPPTVAVTVSLPPVVAVPMPAASVRAPARQGASRGTAGGGAGWTGGAGNFTNRKAGGPFGIGDGLAADGVTRHIVYVLDTSGSMKSRLSRAEDELTEALHGLHAGETFNIVTFTGGSELFDPDMAEAAPGSIQRASAFLSGLEANGDTDLEDAVVRALMLRDVNEVVILTDGVPTVGETDPEKLVVALRRFNIRHARISTIGLVGRNPDGTDGSFAAAHLLQQIATDSGGAAKLVKLGSAAP